MDPLTGALLGGATGLVGSAVSGLFNQSSAQQQENYQTQMSDTSYQRATADMKAAGLNPMLAITNGGASTPGGASATMPDLAGPISQGANTGLALKQQAQQQDMNDANISNIHAQNNTEMQKASLTANQSAAAGQDVKSKNLQNQLLEQTIPSLVKKAQAEGDYAGVSQLLGVVGAASSSAKNLLGLGLAF